jgi:hypothetical protein
VVLGFCARVVLVAVVGGGQRALGCRLGASR